MEQKKVGGERIRVSYRDVDDAFDELAGGVTNSKLGTLLTAEALATMAGDRDMVGFGKKTPEEVQNLLDGWARRFADEDFENITDEDLGFLASYCVKRQTLSRSRSPKAAGKLRDWWREGEHPWLEAYRQKIKPRS
jgi:hypothetical protein